MSRNGETTNNNDDLVVPPRDLSKDNAALIQGSIVTRRSFLLLTSTAVAGTATSALGGDENLADTLSWSANNRQVTLYLKEEEKWIIRANDFGGSATIEIKEDSATKLFFKLKDATFPGTLLEADCSIQIELKDEPKQVKIKFGSFSARLALKEFCEFLKGTSSLSFNDHIDSHIFQQSDLELKLNGNAIVSISNKWDLEFSGHDLILCNIGSTKFTADKATISLYTPQSIYDNSSLHAPLAGDGHPDYLKTRRCLMQVERCEKKWELNPAVHLHPGASLDFPINTFDQLKLQCQEDIFGRKSTGLLLSQKDIVKTATFTLHRELKSIGGNTFKVPFSNISYEWAIFGTYRLAAISGATKLGSTWLHASSISFLISDGIRTLDNAGRNLRIKSINDKPSEITLLPRINAYLASLDSIESDIIVDPTELNEPDIFLDISYSGSSNDYKLRIDQLSGGICCTIENFRTHVIRPKDLLNLIFEFMNCRIEVTSPLSSNSAVIKKSGEDQEHSNLITHFPPQHISEQAYFETNATSETSDAPGRVQALLANPSRLAFRLLFKTETAAAFSLEDVLREMMSAQMNVCDVALAPIDKPLASPPKIKEPKTWETAIDFPTGLSISPPKSCSWDHSTTPVQKVTQNRQRTELWHTRLKGPCGIATGDINSSPTVRAIWSPSYVEGINGTISPEPFRQPMDGSDRYQLVRLTSDFHLKTVTGYPYLPSAVRANQFMLSSLGSWADFNGEWDPLSIDPKEISIPFTLSKWIHRSTMARDNYVEMNYEGFILPGGHRATLVKVTERRFESKINDRVAYLRQRVFLRRKDVTINYPNGTNEFKFPLTSVTWKTAETPPLDEPIDDQTPNTVIAPPRDWEMFFPRVSGADYNFDFSGIDHTGTEHHWQMPIMFVSLKARNQKNPVNPTQYLYPTVDYYNKTIEGRKTVHFLGKTVAFAKSTDNKPGDTSYETSAVVANVFMDENILAHPYYPLMDSAQITVPAIRQLSPSSNASNTKVTYSSEYKKTGFEGNKTQSFLEVKSGIEFAADTANSGICKPDMACRFLSRKLGVIGGDPDAGGPPNLNIENIFGHAKLLGIMELFRLLVPDVPDDDPEKLPKISCIPNFSEQLDANGVRLPPRGYETTQEWRPKVKSIGKHLVFRKEPRGLYFRAHFRSDFITGESTYDIFGEVTDFYLGLAGMLEVEFEKVKFVSGKDTKTKFDPVIKDIRFSGPLEFVNKLKSFMNSKSMGSGPYLEISLSSISAGFRLQIPSLTLGALNIQNMAFKAGIVLEFSKGVLSLEFCFCEKQNPFLLTVGIFGGGGFFCIRVVPPNPFSNEESKTGVVMMEAAIEFGGCAALELGVASGKVYALAGIYYKKELTTNGDIITLTGYFRCGGALRILGFITLSLEFYLALEYREGDGTTSLRGIATLTVKIEMFFFSVSVSLRVERQFSGSARESSSLLMGESAGKRATATQALSFRESMSRAAWKQYCGAFAKN